MKWKFEIKDGATAETAATLVEATKGPSVPNLIERILSERTEGLDSWEVKRWGEDSTKTESVKVQFLKYMK